MRFKMAVFIACMGSAMPVYAEPYPMDQATLTIPVTAEVIGTDEVINCAMTADGLPEGCEIVEPAGGSEDDE